MTFDMVNYLKYCKVQVLDCYLKIEYGIDCSRRPLDIEIKRYRNTKDAILQA